MRRKDICIIFLHIEWGDRDTSKCGRVYIFEKESKWLWKLLSLFFWIYKAKLCLLILVETNLRNTGIMILRAMGNDLFYQRNRWIFRFLIFSIDDNHIQGIVFRSQPNS